MKSTFFAASFNSCMSFFLPSITSYLGRKPLSTSTARSRFGKSLMCPSEAFTMKFFPRYLLIVFAFAGDSTITSDFAICTQLLSQNKPRGSLYSHHGSYGDPAPIPDSGYWPERPVRIGVWLPHFNKVPAGLLANQSEHLQFEEGCHDLGGRRFFHGIDQRIELD